MGTGTAKKRLGKKPVSGEPVSDQAVRFDDSRRGRDC